MQWSYLESFQDSPSPYLKKKSFTNATQQKVCTSGEKYNPTTDTCVPCEEGTYQDTINHTLTSCKPHEQIVCEPSKMLNQNLYTEKKKDKTKPIKYEDVCNDDAIYRRLKSLKNGLDNNDNMNITQNDIKNMFTFQKVADFRSSSDVLAYDENALDTSTIVDEPSSEPTPTKTVIIGKTENVENGYNRIVNLAEVELYDDQGQLIKIDPNNVSGVPIDDFYNKWIKNLVDGIYRNFGHTGDSRIPDSRKRTDEQEKQYFKIVLTTPTIISKIVIVDREKGAYKDRLKKVKVKLLAEDEAKHFETANIPDNLISAGNHKYIHDFTEEDIEKAWKKENIDLSKTHPLAGFQLIRHQASSNNPIMYGDVNNNKLIAIEDKGDITVDKYWLFEPVESQANTYRLKAVNKNRYMTYVGDGQVWYSTKPDWFYNILFESVGDDNYIMSRADEKIGRVYFGYQGGGKMQALNARDNGSDVSKFKEKYPSIRVIVKKDSSKCVKVGGVGVPSAYSWQQGKSMNQIRQAKYNYMASTLVDGASCGHYNVYGKDLPTNEEVSYEYCTYNSGKPSGAKPDSRCQAHPLKIGHPGGHTTWLVTQIQKPPIKRSGDTGWSKKIGETYTCMNESKPNIGCNNSSGQGVDWKDDSQCPESSYMYCY